MISGSSPVVAETVTAFADWLPEPVLAAADRDFLGACTPTTGFVVPGIGRHVDRRTAPISTELRVFLNRGGLAIRPTGTGR
jgi:hypothetical protein